ncbi:hypothetical protein ACFO5T_01195 [Dokdonia genika]|uniref:Uncharacterized protein n=1 Tax=Dokdonia genika TaxID=308113 RepID=A0ABV9L6M2_9FLAO
MSSFTTEALPPDCDAIAEDFYHSSLAGGYSQADATHAYMVAFETCTYEDGGNSIYTTNIE